MTFPDAVLGRRAPVVGIPRVHPKVGGCRPASDLAEDELAAAEADDEKWADLRADLERGVR